MNRFTRALHTLGASIAILAAIGSPAFAAVPPYTLVGAFNLPAQTSAFDITPDGRLIAIANSQFFLQSTPTSSIWNLAGSVPASAVSSFGASFLRLSPDASTIAIGDGLFGPAAQVSFLSFASLDPLMPSPLTSISSPNFQAHWRDNSHLLVTGAAAESVVNEVTITGPALSLRTVVNDIAGASAGVTTDGAFLYTANGFSFGGPSSTGEIHAFPLSAIDAASSPLSFESQGIPVARALTGASLGFDNLGNLLVGGGDAFTPGADNGFAAIIDASDLAIALTGGPLASPTLTLTPPPPASPSNSYSAQSNPATNELLLSFFDNTSFTPGLTIYRYALPSPASSAALLLALSLIAARRRRHA